MGENVGLLAQKRAAFMTPTGVGLGLIPNNYKLLCQRTKSNDFTKTNAKDFYFRQSFSTGCKGRANHQKTEQEQKSRTSDFLKVGFHLLFLIQPEKDSEKNEPYVIENAGYFYFIKWRSGKDSNPRPTD